ncbi:MAG: glyoxalase superfamily protein [Candidatus Omnitrophota bacterium]
MVALRFNHIAPHFFSSDVARSKEFYEGVLGFSLDYSNGEPPSYIVMRRDDVYLHLSCPGPYGVPKNAGAAFVAVAGVESLWEQASAWPKCIADPLKDADYGGGVRFKAFAVQDPDGNLLRIGEPLPYR